MLTDIFERRYKDRRLFTEVGQRELALIVQGFRMVDEQLFRYYTWEGKVDEKSKAIWTSLHDRLSMEIGVQELSPKWYSYQTEWMGKPHTNTGQNAMNFVVQQWMLTPFLPTYDEDSFVKRRLSFIELAFRERERQINELNAQLPAAIRQAEAEELLQRGRPGMRVPGSRVDAVRALNATTNATFQANVHELNERFRQAGTPLHYHNGFIQITADMQIGKQVEEPFWALVADPKWMNVDTDMKEAIDRRDTGGRDPAFYASKALESTIKIICAEKKWTTGKEKGASDYLNHLEAKANGPFVEPWERTMMQRLFTDVRNELGHGPGGDPMPNLSAQQTDFAIEFCMSWIRSLIKRL